jgi:hypothetical protein
MKFAGYPEFGRLSVATTETQRDEVAILCKSHLKSVERDLHPRGGCEHYSNAFKRDDFKSFIN